MNRRLLTSAVVIHAGACLVAFMALGSQSPSQEFETVDESEMVSTRAATSENFESEASAFDSAKSEASEKPAGEPNRGAVTAPATYLVH